MTRIATVIVLCLAGTALSAQRKAPAADTVAPAPHIRRASWLSDRRPVGVGDLLTVDVDEHMDASETSTENASAQRMQQNQLSAQTSATGATKSFGFSTGANRNSQNEGDAARHGDLTAVLTVRVVSIEPNGALHVEGVHTVVVDGRQQVVKLKGTIRPDDVTPTNEVPSSRIADVTIEYKGKNVNPKSGLFGRILGMLWP